MAEPTIPEPISQRKAETYVPARACPKGHRLKRVLDGKCVQCKDERDRLRGQRRCRNRSAEPLERRRALNTAERRAALDDQTLALTVVMRGAVGRAASGRETMTLFALTGYRAAELRTHLERQFLPGMSWANRRAWHVDHIIPIAHFGPYRVGDEAFRACWALSNLRPLWALENQRKGAARAALI